MPQARVFTSEFGLPWYEPRDGCIQVTRVFRSEVGLAQWSFSRDGCTLMTRVLTSEESRDGCLLWKSRDGCTVLTRVFTSD